MSEFWYSLWQDLYVNTNTLDLVTLSLEFDLLYENFNLGNHFWTVSTRVLIFHTSILCDKTILWLQTFFTLWPWPWSLAYFLNFNLATYNNFWTVSARALIEISPEYSLWRDLSVWPLTLNLAYFFENVHIAKNLSTVSARVFIFPWIFLVIRFF